MTDAWRVRRPDMTPHVQHLVDLAKGCRTLIEFGVSTGTGTHALLAGMESDGHLVSVDVGRCNVDDHVRNDPRWTYVEASSIDPATVAQLPRNADLAFVDSGHSYELTWQELVTLGLLGTRRIALHDYLFPISEDPQCRVREAVDDFIRLGIYEWEALYESHWGLAVICRS